MKQNGQPIKLHLGCGLNVVEGWVNVDGSWGVLLAQYPLLRKFLKLCRIFPDNVVNTPWNSTIVLHDLRKKLPFNSNSVQMIYSSHTLEHLHRSHAQQLLEECFRVLSPGGILRIVVPDLKTMALSYVSGDSPPGSSALDGDSPLAGTVPTADSFIEGLLLRNPVAPQGNVLHRLYQSLNDFQSHKWMYDANSLKKHFEEAGLRDVQALSFRKSQIEDIEKLDQEGRFQEGPEIYIEGKK